MNRASIQQAFTYLSSEKRKQEACAAFVALFCQQASKLCPARAIPGIENGWREELEIAAREVYKKRDRLITNKTHSSSQNSCIDMHVSCSI
jgi:hypothetical protein